MSRRRGPRALACFLRGLRLSLSKPYLAVALWLIQLLLSAALILPISNALHALLDRSPAADRMVAIPDYGWWETVRREHPGPSRQLSRDRDRAPVGRRDPLVRASRDARDRRHGVLARAARDRPARLRPRRHARHAARALLLARHVRPGGHAADAGVSALHVRGFRRRVRGVRMDLRRLRRSAPRTGSRSSTPSRPRWP